MLSTVVSEIASNVNSSMRAEKERALAGKAADVFVIDFGVNDRHSGEFYPNVQNGTLAGIEALVRSIRRRHPGAAIIIIEAYETPDHPEVNLAYRKVAEYYGVLLVSFNAAVGHHVNSVWHSNHPSEKVHYLVAKAVASAWRMVRYYGPDVQVGGTSLKRRVTPPPLTAGSALFESCATEVLTLNTLGEINQDAFEHGSVHMHDPGACGQFPKPPSTKPNTS